MSSSQSGKTLKNWCIALVHAHANRVFISCCDDDRNRQSLEPFGKRICRTSFRLFGIFVVIPGQYSFSTLVIISLTRSHFKLVTWMFAEFTGNSL